MEMRYIQKKKDYCIYEQCFAVRTVAVTVCGIVLHACNLKLVFPPRYERLQKTCSIALVGKYTKLRDCYASVFKALEHSALAINHKLNLMVSPGLLVWVFQSFTPDSLCFRGVDCVERCPNASC